MILDRDLIASGRLTRLVEMAAAEGLVEPMAPKAMEASRRGFLDGGDVSQGLWVFAYGSLLWNPAFHHVDKRVAILRGYHRRFCLWTTFGRGTKENPGLMLALERGGSCRGLALKIAPEAVESETKVLWSREMLANSYRPRWLTLAGAEGTIKGLAFVINRDGPRYTGALSEEVVARHIASAEGPIGRCADYLEETAGKLETLGLGDARLNRLRAEVRALRAAT